MNRTLFSLALMAIVPMGASCSKPRASIEKEPIVAQESDATVAPPAEVRSTPLMEREGNAVHADAIATPREDATPDIHEIAATAKPVTKAPAPTSKDWDVATEMPVS